MDSFTLLIVIIAAFGLGFVFRKRRRGAAKATAGGGTESLVDYNKDFLDHSEGKAVIRIAKTFNPGDLAIIRSLFQSEGIYSYVEYENMNSLYPGLAIDGYTDTSINIFEEDRDDALVILKEYVRDLVEAREGEEGHAARNVAELALGGMAVPDTKGKTLPEILE